MFNRNWLWLYWLYWWVFCNSFYLYFGPLFSLKSINTKSILFFYAPTPSHLLVVMLFLNVVIDNLSVVIFSNQDICRSHCNTEKIKKRHSLYNIKQSKIPSIKSLIAIHNSENIFNRYFYFPALILFIEIIKRAVHYHILGGTHRFFGHIEGIREGKFLFFRKPYVKKY